MVIEKLSDIQVLSKCIEACDAREEGVNLQWVLDSVARKFYLTLNSMSSPINGGGTSTEFIDVSKMSIAQLYRLKKPINAMQTLVVLGYYVLHKEPGVSISTSSLTDARDEAGITGLANIRRDLDNAIRTARYITGGSNKKLSILGEDIFNALPNQELVEEAIKSHKVVSRRKKKK